LSNDESVEKHGKFADEGFVRRPITFETVTHKNWPSGYSSSEIRRKHLESITNSKVTFVACLCE